MRELYHTPGVTCPTLTTHRRKWCALLALWRNMFWNSQLKSEAFQEWKKKKKTSWTAQRKPSCRLRFSRSYILPQCHWKWKFHLLNKRALNQLERSIYLNIRIDQKIENRNACVACLDPGESYHWQLRRTAPVYYELLRIWMRHRRIITKLAQHYRPWKHRSQQQARQQLWNSAWVLWFLKYFCMPGRQRPLTICGWHVPLIAALLNDMWLTNWKSIILRGEMKSRFEHFCDWLVKYQNTFIVYNARFIRLKLSV